ncbi:MAG: hypothetical protein JWO08_3345 [Verrucomicrobiaceae bacterium]|nr:hypothetical protein [Verrucomicrobiaceae bacterium]
MGRETPGMGTVGRPQRLLTGLNLDAGETEAISLASEETGALLIMDERKGRRVAAGLGILVAGMLNILEEASPQGWWILSMLRRGCAQRPSE